MTAGIVGTGLIGASIGMGLKIKGHRVIGFDASEENRQTALRRYAIDEIVALEQVAKADAVFVAVPPARTVEVLELLYPNLGPDSVLTDTASVKGEVAEWGAGREQFIAGHPMAGHEKGGPKFASNWLFRGAKWILCPSDAIPKKRIAVVEGLIRELDATPVHLNARDHDRHTAIVSHLPHILAGLLLDVGQELSRPEASGGSWKDLTRVGGVDPELWSQIVMTNRKELAIVLKEFQSRLGDLVGEIENGNQEAVFNWFQQNIRLKERMG